MKIGIFAKLHRTDFSDSLQSFIEWLQERGCQPLVDSRTAENYRIDGIEGAPKDRIPSQSDLIIVLGGDGTLLSVVRQVGGQGTPILGVNLGTLGFLTSVRIDDLYPAVERVLRGEYRIDRRGLLKTEIRKPDEAAQVHHAFNDVVINKSALARIISMEAFIDDDFIARFLADGLIVSTPTGSTAYSLSAGGPILFPSLEAFIVTPICPHTLTNRPFVVPAKGTIRIELKDGDDVMATIDGQVGVELTCGSEIVCTQSEYRIDLIQPSNQRFFDVLREKLKWGER